MGITKSPEEPIGRIPKFLFRMELQDAKANVPHLHSILWTADDLLSPEGLMDALGRIRGFLGDIIRPNEREEYFKKGIFKSADDIASFTAMMGQILLNPCPAEHSFVDIKIDHTQEAISVMQAIGAARLPGLHAKSSKLVFEPLEPCLLARKHVPPAHGNEGMISPVPGRLVAINPNTDNIQYTTGYTLARYLAKYIVSVDCYNVISIKPPSPEQDSRTFNVQGELLLNTKVTGNRTAQKQKAPSKRTPKRKQGRAINVAEFYMMLFGYAPIMTNLKWVDIPTQPFEERAARERQKPIEKLVRESEYLQSLQTDALTAVNTCASHHVRMLKDFPAWRQFTPSQLKKIEDDLESPLSTDLVTVFGVRPPELRFVMSESWCN